MQFSRIEPGFQVRPIQVRDHADVLQGDHLRVSVALRAPGTCRTLAAQDQQGIGFDRDLGLLCHEALSEMAHLQNGRSLSERPMKVLGNPMNISDYFSRSKEPIENRAFTASSVIGSILPLFADHAKIRS